VNYNLIWIKISFWVGSIEERDNETNDNLTFILQLLHRNFKTSDRINLSLYTHPLIRENVFA
jgi:hypothetical protein